MANINCDACSDLRNDAPNVVVNGITDTECASLKNNTGLSPSSGNDDCKDLDNLNDCLIGNLEGEIEAYDVCEWKPFMKKFLPNLWTVLKGIICAVCGVWTNIATIWERLELLCKMISVAVAPEGRFLGIRERGSGPNYGTIPQIGGRPAVIDNGDATASSTGVGVYHGIMEGVNCETGGTRKSFYFRPYIYGHDLNGGVTEGVALWVIDKATWQAQTKTNDAWWNAFTQSSWMFRTGYFAEGTYNRLNIWVRVHVGSAGYSNNYLVMTYEGSAYPNQSSLSDDTKIVVADQNDWHWYHNI